MYVLLYWRFRESGLSAIQSHAAALWACRWSQFDEIKDVPFLVRAFRGLALNRCNEMVRLARELPKRR